MQGNGLTDGFWIIVAFVGAFVLFGAIVWSRRQNKGITPEQHRRSEQATHDLYQEPVDDDSASR